MEDTLGFLRAILPEQGFKCAVHIVGQNPKALFYATHEELAQQLLRLDALGGNVYHGCAAYSGTRRQTVRDVKKNYAPRRHREKEDVTALQCFWLDIDSQITKPDESSYATAYEAAVAVHGFCGTLGIPPPMLVGSGAGLHCYWPLVEPIGRDEWERYARGLKAACDKLGLEAGRERTADCASILRPPGTHHRKAEPQLVQCGPLPAPVSLAALAPWLEFASEYNSRQPVVPRGPQRTTGLGAKLRNARSTDIVDFETLADRCAQLGLLRETKGLVPEPLWHASMVLLAHCHDGERIAHEWSSGHPTYSFEETESYIARGRTRTGPTTCAHFEDVNPDGCRGCPYAGTITTPLGTLFKSAEPVEAHIDATVLGTSGGDDRRRLELPENFKYRNGGLCLDYEAKDGTAVYKQITGFPIYLAAVQYGEVRSASRFYCFRHYLPHHGWTDIEIPAGVARGNNALSALAEAGLNVHDGETFRQFVIGSVDMYNANHAMQVQYEQYGWKGETSFLYGDRLYTPEETIIVPASAELKFRNQWLSPREKGSLDGWKQAADRLFGAGSEGQSFAVLAAFAAPLMRFVNDSEGGAIISLVTRATGTGKSSSLAGAYTVFASDRRALSLTTIDTGNAKGVAMATIGNLPVIHDEFQGDPEVTKAFVKLFTEGRDKQRLDRDGQMRHTVGTWQTLLFTASNTSLVDTIGALGSSDALAYRILEFPVESAGAFSPAEADRLRKMLELNAGWAGHIFLEYIVRPDVLEWIRSRLPASMEEIYAAGGFTREHRFWVRTLACVAVAAQIVEHLGLVAFSPARILNWGIKFFAEKERPSIKEMRYWLGAFINAHAGEMLVMPTAWSPRSDKKLGVLIPPRVPNKLTIRRDEDTGRYFVSYDPLKAWLIRHDIGINELIRELHRQEIVIGVKSRVLGAGTNLAGGQVKVIEVDGAHPLFGGALREVGDADKKNAAL